MEYIGGALIAFSAAAGIVIQGIRGENLWEGLGMGAAIGFLLILPLAGILGFLEWRRDKKRVKRVQADREKRLRYPHNRR